MTPVKWIVVIASVAVIVGLLIWARGEDHQRGDEVGSIARVTGR